MRTELNDAHPRLFSFFTHYQRCRKKYEPEIFLVEPARPGLLNFWQKAPLPIFDGLYSATFFRGLRAPPSDEPNLAMSGFCAQPENGN